MATAEEIQIGGEPPQTPQHYPSKFTVAAMAAVAVVLLMICVDVVVIDAERQAPPRPVVQVVKVSGAQPVVPVVDLTVSPAIKPGPNNVLHDAFSVTNFVVHAGRPITLVINNTDSSPHSINAPGIDVNIVARPGVHSYTLLVRKTGRFEWSCMLPCDPYSMAHLGYMRGYITSV